MFNKVKGLFAPKMEITGKDKINSAFAGFQESVDLLNDGIDNLSIQNKEFDEEIVKIEEKKAGNTNEINRATKLKNKIEEMIG